LLVAIHSSQAPHWHRFVPFPDQIHATCIFRTWQGQWRRQRHPGFTQCVPLLQVWSSSAIEKDVKAAEVTQLIAEHKKTALRHLGALRSPLRRAWLMGLELAEGLPHSATREKQLERLQDDPTFKLNNSDCPRGSLVWKEVSRSLLLFLLFPISVFLLFPVSSV
jgi:hypothetical protein